MASTLTPDQFINVIEQSGLVDKSRLSRFVKEKTPSDGSKPAPEELADALVKKGWLTEWQTKKLLQGRHKGFLLGKYKLMRLLGKGGMSSVYLAEHTVMRRRCAIKVLPTKRVNDSSYLGRFLREAQAVATMDHVNIVRAYDIDKQVDGAAEIHFLVMEYVEGDDLQEMVQKHGLMEPAMAANYIRQGADGLSHAHGSSMVHRDIKPGNLLVDLSGTVKILDMGLARFFDEDDEEQSLTVAHDEKVLGTADYLAPEQAIDSHGVDHRADIYSLGCTFYYCLTGKPPFTEGTLAQRLLAHQTKKPKPIEEYRDDVPEGLLTIIQKMMAKNKDERYQSADDVSRDLLAWLLENTDEAWRMEHLRLQGGSESGSQIGSDSASKLAAAAELETIPPADVPETDDGELSSFLSSFDPSAPSTPAETPREPAPDSAPIFEPPAMADAPSSPDSSGDEIPDFSAFGGGTESKPDSTPLIDSGDSGALPLPIDDDSSNSGSGLIPADSGVVDSPDSATSKSSTRNRKSNTEKGIPKGLIASLSIVLVLGLGWVAWSYFAGDGDGGGTDVTGDGGTETDILADGELTVGKDGDFKTIAEAVDYVAANLSDDASGVTIRLAPGTYNESLNLSSAFGADTPTVDGLKIIGDSKDRPVIDGKGKKAAVTIDSLSLFRLENVEINAEGQETGIVVKGGAGNEFRNVKVSGHEKNGIHVIGFAPFLKDDRLLLEQVEISGSGSGSAGVRISPPSIGGIVKHVTIDQLSVLPPFKSGVLIEGDVQELSLKNSIFAGDKKGEPVGLHFTTAVSVKQVTIENNTFHDLAKGVQFAAGPKAGSAALSVQRNLFAGVPQELAQGANANLVQAVMKGNAKSNVTSNASPNPPLLFSAEGKTGVKPEFVSTKPGKRSFMKPGNDDVAKVGKPTGSQKPYAGAVAP